MDTLQYASENPGGTLMLYCSPEKLCLCILLKTKVMHIYSRGFNLYGQLNHSKDILPKFEITFQDENVQTLNLSHTFGIITTCQGTVKATGMEPKNLENTFNKLKYIQISCNNTLILILNEKHNIIKVSLDCPEKINQVPKFTQDNDKITKISAGETLFLAYTESGKLYSIPEQLKFERKGIVDIKTGKEHCLMLHANGDIYSFGRGSRGQLGHGNLEDETRPKLIEALAGIKIVQISAGGWHSLALSADGDIYSWGWNCNGQLGLSTDHNKESTVQVMATPTVVELNNNYNVLKIASGARHSLALLENNTLCGCGWNKYKQLQEETQENYYLFVPLHEFVNEKVLDITCGPWNSAVICK